MRAALLVVALCVTLNAHAGLFGPSTIDECLQKYAVPAQVDVAAGAAASWCRVIFPREGDQERKKFERDRAQCILDSIADVKSEAGLGQLIGTCTRKYPQPPNPFDQFDSTTPAKQ